MITQTTTFFNVPKIIMQPEEAVNIHGMLTMLQASKSAEHMMKYLRFSGSLVKILTLGQGEKSLN